MTEMTIVPSSFVSPEWIAQMNTTPTERVNTPHTVGPKLKGILKNTTQSPAIKRQRFLGELNMLNKAQRKRLNRPGAVRIQTQKKSTIKDEDSLYQDVDWDTIRQHMVANAINNTQTVGTPPPPPPLPPQSTLKGTPRSRFDLTPPSTPPSYLDELKQVQKARSEGTPVARRTRRKPRARENKEDYRPLRDILGDNFGGDRERAKDIVTRGRRRIEEIIGGPQTGKGMSPFQHMKRNNRSKGFRYMSFNGRKTGALHFM